MPVILPARASATRSGYFAAVQHAPVITIGGSTRTSTVDLDDIRITE